VFKRSFYFSFTRNPRVSRIREIIVLLDFDDFISYKRLRSAKVRRRRGFLRMWLDHRRKDELLEKWYTVRKDNEARASQKPRTGLRQNERRLGRARKLEGPRALEMIERPRKLNSRIRSCRLGSSN